ncbi:hypothetical protein MTO96_015782 [Rhipicephalus appendiculatus]
MTASSASALATEIPVVVATAGRYSDFMEAYKAHRNSQDVLTLIEQYANLCDSYLDKVRKVTEGMVSRKGEQFMEEGSDDTTFVDGTREASDREVVDALMARNSLARQAQLVVDWLESCAAHQCGMANDDDRLDARSSYVTELDPEAALRQRLPIYDLERDDECRLFRSVFFHLRAGQLQRAQQLAAGNGHHWLAAAVEGWRPYHGRNSSVMGAGATQPAEGNLYRDLWKRDCWDAASNPTCSLYLRAMYGALSGNVQAMLPTCTTWQDQLWARMRALVDVCVEQELHTVAQEARNLEPLPPGYPNDRGIFVAVFRDVQAAVNTTDMREREIMRILQRCVVLGDALSMVEEMHDWPTAQMIKPPLQTMRFLAHMVLLLRKDGYETGTGAYSALLRTYVDLLIDEGHAPWLPRTQPLFRQPTKSPSTRSCCAASKRGTLKNRSFAFS